MSDASNGIAETGHFRCPCATCILIEAQKYEEKKQYRKADLVIKNGLQYHSNMTKQLEEELKKFHIRTKYCISNSENVASSSNRFQESVQFTHCQHSTYQLNTKTKKFTCPVAIFDPVSDPKQKPMYPKSVVYLKGNDHQLEEIRAARYWINSSLEQEKIPENVKKIILSEEFISFVKGGAEEQEKNPEDSTNVIERVHSLTTTSKLSRYQMETENINPSAPEILDGAKNSNQSIQQIISEKLIIGSPLTELPENLTNHTSIPSTNKMRAFSLSEGNQISSSKTSEEVPMMSARLGTIEKTNTSQKSIETNGMESVLISDERTICNLSEDAPIKSRISPTITFGNSKVGEDKTSLEKPVSVVSVSEIEQPIPSMDVVFRDTHGCSKIPTRKKFTSNVEQDQTEESRREDPSKTYVIKPHNNVPAAQNPSETYVIKPFDIDKETLTLVQDDDDDLDTGTLKRRTTQLFQPPDMDSSATEAFHTALPCSTPNKRMSLFFKPPKIDTNENRYSISSSVPLPPNLSTITEISRENYNSSSRPSQKTPLGTINEVEQNDESLKNDSVEVIPDPFDVDLIEHLLQKIQFPQSEHQDGFNQINCDMAQLKLSSVVKLGNSKYSIISEIGKGNYARILKLQDVKEPSKSIALKQQKPACPWEFYISKEIQRRLRSDLEKSYFIQYTEIFVYRNGSVMASQWAPYGSILNFVNNLKISPYHNKRCPISVAIWLSIQFVEAVQYLHSCKIIHGDVKPDNFVLYDEISTDHASVKLIDYGRAIDMSLFPKNVIFSKVVTTEDFTCNEMKDNRPWTYQTDLFGLASTIYMLLVGEYMKTKKGPCKKWTLQKNFPRYINRDMWNPIFDHLLNIPSCTELPDLVSIRQTLEADFNSIDRQIITQQFTNIGAVFKK